MGYFLQPMREALLRLNITVWLELTCGNSWRKYRCLDMYIKLMGAGMMPPAQEAHYLLNSEVWGIHRYAPNQDQWYLHGNWESIGQHDCIDEWHLENRGTCCM